MYQLEKEEACRKLREIAISWLPTDSRMALFSFTSIICLSYAICTGNTGMILAIWTAVAAYAGIETGKGVINKVKTLSPRKSRKRRLPKAE